MLGVKFVPITFEAQGRQRKMAIAGIGDADITAIAGLDGKEIRIENLRNRPFPTVRNRPFPTVAAKSTHTAYKDFDLRWEISSKNGYYGPFAFSSA